MERSRGRQRGDSKGAWGKIRLRTASGPKCFPPRASPRPVVDRLTPRPHIHIGAESWRFRDGLIRKWREDRRLLLMASCGHRDGAVAEVVGVHLGAGQRTSSPVGELRIVEQPIEVGRQRRGGDAAGFERGA